MAPRAALANGVIVEPVALAEPPIPTTKLPDPLRFPILVALNLGLSALCYSISSEFTAGDLSSVSRSLNEWWQVAGLVGCKVLELAVGWWGEYDGYDIASLTLISHLPTLWLLTAFYAIRPTTALTSILIDIAATCIPFSLLRPVLPAHTPNAPKGSVANRSIINDLPVQSYIVALAAGIYTVVFYGSFLTWLPVHLVLYFNGLRNITAAHTANAPKLMMYFLPVGMAVKSFLFVTATGAARNLSEKKALAFNPETATLCEAIQYNFWGYSKRTRTMIKRTLTLAAVSFVNTVLQLYFTIEGSEGYGALGWAAVWATATLVTGAVLWSVGDVEGINN